MDQKIGVIPWSPLARGLLTKRNDDVNATERAKTDGITHQFYTRDINAAIADRVTQVSTNRGLPNAQIALAWLLSKPVVTAPIVGATKANHLEDAVAATSVKLTEEEIRLLEEPYQPQNIVGF